MEMLKVASESNPNSVAGAITSAVDKGQLEIQVVGAGALNQAVKAIIIARGHIAPLGYNLKVVPAFIKLKVDNEEKTGIKLVVVKECI